jgi:glutathione S-transferase
VHVPLEGGRHPNVARWLDTVGRRPSVVQSEEVRPADGA